MATNRKICTRLLVLALTAVALYACGPRNYTIEEAQKRVGELSKSLRPQEKTARITDLVDTSGKASLADHLPAIETFPLVVDPELNSSVVVAEILCSTEKSGSGRDGWMVEVATQFNDANVRLPSGKTAKISIRKIDSGTASQFFISGKYAAAGYSPSNELWIKMIQNAGLDVEIVSPRLVGNIAGIVMKKAIHEQMKKLYSTVDFKAIVDATVKGSLFMGYTNPFASSTGINFLQTVLISFANGDEAKALEPGAVSAFEAFQKGVPFVSLTTIQMRESVESNGSLDAFVLERQSYEGLKQRDDYIFIPFGIRHDNPLAAIGAMGTEEKQALALFASFAGDAKHRQLASQYGFNLMDEYTGLFNAPTGEFLAKAQALWKEKKDSGRPIVAVFVADVSGSMSGDRIDRLREALHAGSKFISAGNSIGLVSFSDEVTKLLPIRPFDARQKAEFSAAVGSLEANGSTALYDALIVAEDMVSQASRQVPDSKPMIILLSDGEPTAGMDFNRVDDLLLAMKVPIYTISYAGDVEVLKVLSRMNEAAALKSDENDIAYQMGSLLNAEM